MQYPIKTIEDDAFDGLGIPSDDKGMFSVVLKDHTQMVSSEELISEIRDQLDIRGAVRKALLRKANKALMAGLKKSRLRLNAEQQEAFDLNFLIWFADKTINGEHQSYLA